MIRGMIREGRSTMCPVVLSIAVATDAAVSSSAVGFVDSQQQAFRGEPRHTTGIALLRAALQYCCSGKNVPSTEFVRRTHAINAD